MQKKGERESTWTAQLLYLIVDKLVDNFQALEGMLGTKFLLKGAHCYCWVNISIGIKNES